jgi:hypothetical protein
MFDDTMDPYDTGLLELTRRLEAYADARLSPSTAASRMRMNVMAAAHRQSALLAAERAREPVAPPTALVVAEKAQQPARRLKTTGAAFMAASLAVAMLAGTAYGAKAGGLFYGTRLWIEAANLPAGHLARAEAEIDRLDARIAEAQQASAEHDAPAAEAALAAYSAIVVEAAAGAVGDESASAVIEVSVSRHVLVLAGLVDSVPGHARGAVQTALTSGSTVIDELNAATTRGTGGRNGAGPSSGGPTQGGPNPGKANSGNGVVSPVSSDQPETPVGDPAAIDKTTPHGRDHDAEPPGATKGGGPAPKPSPTPRTNSPSKAPDREQGDSGGSR